MCKYEIDYREAYLYVPYKLLLTIDMAFEIPQLKEIIDANKIF